MTFEEYERLAMRTMPVRPEDDQKTCLIIGALGAAGEAGELANKIKKRYFHGHEISDDELKTEVGDNLWYLQYVAYALGVSLEEIAQADINKLLARYPEGFSHEASRNRSDHG